MAAPQTQCAENTDAHNPEEEEEPPQTDRTDESSSSPKATVDDFLYGIASFDAICKPVFVTMILSALASIYISTPDSRRQGQESLSNSYIVIQGSDDDTDGQKLGQSLVNGLVIVSVIGLMTFVIVLLYKYRCMKILVGYMIVAMTSLLGFVSSQMFSIAIERYELYVDRVSYAMTIYNFALVGTISLFFGQGIPSYISQCYLIAISVIVAWQLSHFDPWTAWVLLVLLALYDLFAVLSPCGPLKALVHLMSKQDAPHLPGLLYEANLNMEQRTRNHETHTRHSDEDSSPHNSTTNNVSADETNGGNEKQSASSSSTRVTNNKNATISWNTQNEIITTTERSSNPIDLDQVDNQGISCGKIPLAIAIGCNIPLAKPIDAATKYSSEELQEETEVVFPENGPFVALHHHQQVEGQPVRYALQDSEKNVQKVLFVSQDGRVMEDRSHMRQTGTIPLAIAKLNKLRFVHGPQPSWVRRAENPTDVDIPKENWTAEELRRDVEVFFPKGWQIVPHVEQRDNEEIRYAVIKPDGSLKRIVFVNNEGKVFEDLRGQNKEKGDEKEGRGSIRLGLGDFIFYSILVSKAALYSFTTFSACVAAILLGLALTLGILAYHGKALPALPISIFLGVTFYFITRYSVQPWAEEVFIQAVYV